MHICYCFHVTYVFSYIVPNPEIDTLSIFRPPFHIHSISDPYAISFVLNYGKSGVSLLFYSKLKDAQTWDYSTRFFFLHKPYVGLFVENWPEGPTHIELQALAPPEISCLGIFNICYTFIFVHVLYWPEGTTRGRSDSWHVSHIFLTKHQWLSRYLALLLLLIYVRLGHTKYRPVTVDKTQQTPCTHVLVCNSLPVCVRMKEYRLDP